MSWLADKYHALKNAWHRFMQWERVFFLREREWRFPISGSVEEFEKRFEQSVPAVSRDEFFRLYRKRKNPRVFGFYGGNELAIKVPNQRTANASRNRVQSRRSVHYFHGTLSHNHNNLCLIGHYRLPLKRAKRVLGAINGGVFSCILVLFFIFILLKGKFLISVVPIGFLLPVPILVWALSATVMGMVICVGIEVPRLIITKRLDRHSCAKTFCLLEEICGKPNKAEAE